MSRDAQPIPPPPAGTPRVETIESRIWIRIGGSWYRGDIQKWYRRTSGWGAWLCYQADPTHPTIAQIWGHYAYDPAAIVDRSRYPDPPER